MHYSKLFCAIGLLGGLVLAGCGRTSSQVFSPSPAASLVGTTWALVELEGQQTAVTTGRGAPTLRLTAENTRAAGFAGCNQFFATYDLAADRLRFGAIGATRMFCIDGSDLEQGYIQALEATRGYRMSGGRLELVGDKGVVARFEAK